MKGDEVGSLEKVVEADQRDVEQLGSLHRNDRVEGDDIHLQTVRTLRDLGADIAESNHAERLAADLGADELRSIPLAPLDRRVCLRNPSSKREQKGNRVLGGSHDIAARRVDHEDSLSGGGRDVNVVDTDA